MVDNSIVIEAYLTKEFFMLEWVLVIVSIFHLFYGYQNVQQTQVPNYQTQYPQAVGNPYGAPQPFVGQWNPQYQAQAVTYPQRY